MTEMAFEDFVLPSETSGGDGGNYPSLKQYAGRLVHILPVTVKFNATSPLRKDPHTLLTVDMTFFDGDPITVVLDKNGRPKAQIDPPLTAGVTQQGRFMNQTWFTKRLADKAGRPGYPGMIGRLTSEPTDSGNDMWMLSDPTPAEVETIKRWWAWKQANPGQGIYTPTPVAQPVQQPQYVQPAQPQYAPQQYAQPAQPQYAQPAAPASPFAPAAAPAPQYAQPVPAQPASPFAPQPAAPADPWANTTPPPVAAPAPQPAQPADPWAPTPAAQPAPATAPPAGKLPWE